MSHDPGNFITFGAMEFIVVVAVVVVVAVAVIVGFCFVVVVVVVDFAGPKSRFTDFSDCEFLRIFHCCTFEEHVPTTTVLLTLST